MNSCYNVHNSGKEGNILHHTSCLTNEFCFTKKYIEYDIYGGYCNIFKVYSKFRCLEIRLLLFRSNFFYPKCISYYQIVLTSSCLNFFISITLNNVYSFLILYVFNKVSAFLSPEDLHSIKTIFFISSY